MKQLYLVYKAGVEVVYVHLDKLVGRVMERVEVNWNAVLTLVM